MGRGFQVNALYNYTPILQLEGISPCTITHQSCNWREHRPVQLHTKIILKFGGNIAMYIQLHTNLTIGGNIAMYNYTPILQLEGISPCTITHQSYNWREYRPMLCCVVLRFRSMSHCKIDSAYTANSCTLNSVMFN